MASNPAYSPWLPALGCRLTAAYPVIATSQRCRSAMICWIPAASEIGANGCSAANSSQVIGSISVVALSFIVQLPKGIMVRSSAMSLSDRARR